MKMFYFVKVMNDNEVGGAKILILMTKFSNFNQTSHN